MEILFVCTGNTCRSPMAEHIALKLSGGVITASSAGLYAYDRDGISQAAREVLQLDYGIDAGGHRARQLTGEMAARADRVLTMTRGHRDSLLARYPQLQGKIMTLKEAAGMEGDICDPYGGSVETYREAAREIEQAIRSILEQMKGEEK